MRRFEIITMVLICCVIYVVDCYGETQKLPEGNSIKQQEGLLVGIRDGRTVVRILAAIDPGLENSLTNLIRETLKVIVHKEESGGHKNS